MESTAKQNLEQILINLIETELKRLEVDTDIDPYSGLAVRETQLDNDTFGVDNSKIRLNIFDDYCDGEYYAEELLKLLKNTDSATLESDHEKNIWEIIAETKI